MKVLHVLYSGLGGHSNVFFSIVDADEQNTFEYEALFNGVEDVREDYTIACNRKNIPWKFIKKKEGKHIAYFLELVRAIRQSKADIIFLHGSIHAPAARLARMLMKGKQKIIVRETQANHLKSKRQWLGLKLAMRLADKVVFLSSEYDAEVKQLIPRFYDASKTAVVPNGLDLNVYQPKVKAATDHFVLGMQSRLVPIKDHETLLKAIALLKDDHPDIDVKLIIAGDGESRKGLEKLTEELGLNNEVVFAGMLKESKLVIFLQSLDIYIHASLGETMSTAIMQAMACAKAIIASDVPGINNMIENNVTGLLVEVKNVAAMAEGLRKLIFNKELATALAAKALKQAETNFSNQLMFSRYKEIFIS